MNIKLKISAIIFYFFFVLRAQYAFSQNLNGLYDLVPNSTKEIDKAVNAISEAGKYMQEANNNYNEALELQSNYELDEKTLQKKIKKAEDKAVALQLKADKLYAEGYKSLYELCLKSLKSSTVSYGESDTYESSATEMVNEASENRKEASDTKNPYKKAELLNDAAGLEGAAIENLIFALQIQNGITPEAAIQKEVTEVPETDTAGKVLKEKYAEQEITQKPAFSATIDQKSENLSVDQGVIRKYEGYINDSSIPDPITISRSGVSGVPNASIDDAINLFYAMHTGNAPIYASSVTSGIEEQQAAIEDSVSLLAQTKIKEIATDKTVFESKDTVFIREKNKRENLDISYSPQSSGVRFMVQIAASRAPITRTQIWAIYPGNLSIEVVKENGWYKYRITNFRVFSDANRVALESGVKSAYVLSTDENNLINLVEAREMTRVLESDLKRYGSKAIKEGTDFYVQVVASRIRLKDEERAVFCGSASVCREIIEEGWFKYQIYAGTSYQQAVDLKNQITGKSFIVAYEKGTKADIYKAINK